ncbi:hypothetical protein [Aeromicrobium sp. NPDC092404]|uniref:hypothetical protein n=1 Tax=Aeromicrobium sp. NPDC092404 TaxID=3154976 RepID=UPI0034355224
MSDPTPSVPELESAPRKRRRIGRRWIIVAAVVAVLALVLGGAAYAVKAKGDAKAEDYAQALDAWNDQRNDLLGAPSKANRDLWSFDEDPTTKKSLKKQKAACEAVLDLRTAAAKDAAAVPEEPDNFFTLLSSDERKAVKYSATHKKAVRAFAKEADEVLVQLRKDCTWNIKVNSTKDDAAGAKKIFDKAKGMLLKPGQTNGNYYCPSTSKVSCLPASVGERTAYVETILNGLKVEKAYFTDRFFAAGACDRTSYGKLCAELKRTLSSYYANLGDYGDVIKSIAPTDSKLRKEFDQMVKDNKAVNKAFKKAMLKAHPRLKYDSRLTEFPFWQDAYFSAMADDAIRKLNNLRGAVVSGSGRSAVSDSESVETLRQHADVRLR